MKLGEVYKKFGSPPNLQEHMLRVCGVTSYICEHWIGKEEFDWEKVRKISLLHDVGNIVKFDFDKYPQFLGDELKNIEYWRGTQKKIIEKYGNDDHDATKNMLLEIGVERVSRNNFE